MYIKKKFPLKQLILWTKNEILIFLALSLIPVILYALLDWKWLHLPWLPISLIGTAVAFITGFKNNASYDRLWEARKIWGGIVNSSRAWGILVKDFITDFESDEKQSESQLDGIKKKLIYRHVGWLAALRHQLRENRIWESHWVSKVSIEYQESLVVPEKNISLDEELKRHLSNDELQRVLNKSNIATQIISLQSENLIELYSKQLINNFRHMEMEKLLIEFYDLQGKCERIKNFPYPRQFATLNRYFVWIFIILLPFGIMTEFEKIGLQMRDFIINNPLSISISNQAPLLAIAENFVWFSIPFSVIVAWVFYAMEKIGESTVNPFKGGINDVPISSISNSIEVDLKEMIEDDNLPEKIIPKNFIVM